MEVRRSRNPRCPQAPGRTHTCEPYALHPIAGWYQGVSAMQAQGGCPPTDRGECERAHTDPASQAGLWVSGPRRIWCLLARGPEQ